MEHVVYLDAKAKELDKLRNGEKCMIIRGATGRKFPYGRVFVSETLWFIENSGDGMVRGKAVVKNVLNSDKLDDSEALGLISDYQSKLCLAPDQIKRWGGKRYLVLIEVEKYLEVTPFRIDRSSFGNMDDWLPVEAIGDIVKPVH
ncbi:MAG: hypothetical protein PHU24_11225 [Sphaerochaetaceae bacterium]|jgi:hypothetical protein|nr:hypothetical protein [Sphaerochaetaceae bacterium]NLO59930.1 hypothetical protein [Spirochaetales bacterium]MDD2407010.1 hypothetical protein [Sphaerochaetaceae bacterium]MDD4258939.1 hypothetical protein [Sphaerochaetaceae bacterium]MDD4840690.1 hypothetical protein [Sphaerochaetaceae bacterium]